jgi:predicted membrane protein
MNNPHCECGAVHIDTLFAKMDVKWMRRISLLLALLTATLITAWPKVLIGDAGHVDHGYLSLLLLANSACFIHGLGYTPTTRLWRYLFTPLFGWPMMIGFWLTMLS